MALASDAASAALTPISGYLLFSAGENLQSIMTTSKDDSIPEPSQFFTVQLGNTDGGARIDTEEDTAILTGKLYMEHLANTMHAIKEYSVPISIVNTAF